MINRMMQQWLAAWRPRFSFAVYKAVLVGMVIAAFAVPLLLVAIPYLDMFNGMAAQPKGKTQSLYGRQGGPQSIVARVPVEGTLPMSFVPYPITDPGDTATQLAADTLTNPLPPTLQVLQEGEHLYNTYCISCHGSMGEGDGPIVGPGLFAAAPTLHTNAARRFKDGHIFHVISRGQNVMPHYSDKLNTKERWAVVHYVRVLQRAMNPQPEDLQ